MSGRDFEVWIDGRITMLTREFDSLTRKLKEHERTCPTCNPATQPLSSIKRCLDASLLAIRVHHAHARRSEAMLARRHWRSRG